MSAQISEVSYRAFLYQTSTLENDRLILGGLCDARMWPEVMSRLQQLAKFSFAHYHDAFSLDWKLSQITASLGKDIAVIGASVEIPNLAERGGGILGSPRQAAASSSLGLDELIDGFFLWTSPGGPGVAFRADKACAVELKHLMEAGQFTTVKQQVTQINDFLQANASNLFLLVCDGSGPQGCCYMAAADDTGFYETSGDG